MRAGTIAVECRESGEQREAARLTLLVCASTPEHNGIASTGHSHTKAMEGDF
jgi:hypothetical protein